MVTSEVGIDPAAAVVLVKLALIAPVPLWLKKVVPELSGFVVSRPKSATVYAVLLTLKTVIENSAAERLSPKFRVGRRKPMTAFWFMRVFVPPETPTVGEP